MLERVDSERVRHRSGIGWFAAQLRARFYLGKIGSGDRLPSVRGLAEDLGVSPTTTLEIYRTLESQGIVEGRQRSGMFLRTVGVEPERSPAQAAMFRLVAVTAHKLRLAGVSAAEFARLLFRYTGDAPRTDFKIAFIGSGESLELIQRQLRARLRFTLPIVCLSPSLGSAELRAEIGAIRHVACLLGTFLGSDATLAIAHQLDLPLVFLRLTPEAAAILQPSTRERRFVVVRDRDTAERLRRLTCAVCHAEHRTQVCPALQGLDDGALPCEKVGHDRLPLVRFAALDEEARLCEFDREADTIHAPVTSIVAVKARFAAKRIALLPVTVSDQTVNDLLFHYLFAERSPAAASGRRP